MPSPRRPPLPSLPSSPAPDAPRASPENILRRILALEACLSNNTPTRPQGDTHPTHSIWRINYLTGGRPFSSTSLYWTRRVYDVMVEQVQGVLHLLKNAVKNAEEMGARAILLVPYNSGGLNELFDKVYKGRIASRCLPTFLDLANFLEGLRGKKFSVHNEIIEATRLAAPSNFVELDLDHAALLEDLHTFALDRSGNSSSSSSSSSSSNRRTRSSSSNNNNSSSSSSSSSSGSSVPWRAQRAQINYGYVATEAASRLQALRSPPPPPPPQLSLLPSPAHPAAAAASMADSNSYQL